jgi:hypothetical protein
MPTTPQCQPLLSTGLLRPGRRGGGDNGIRLREGLKASVDLSSVEVKYSSHEKRNEGRV